MSKAPTAKPAAEAPAPVPSEVTAIRRAPTVMMADTPAEVSAAVVEAMPKTPEAYVAPAEVKVEEAKGPKLSARTLAEMSYGKSSIENY